MPRWNRDASPDAAAQQARQRFASRMVAGPAEPPLLQLTDPDEPGGLPDDAMVAGPRLRWRTPWRVAALVAVLGVGLIAWHLWQSAVGQSTSIPLNPAMSAGTGTGPEPDVPGGGTPEPSERPQLETPGSAGSLLVHVAGAVQKPGVVSLPEGSRTFQAIEAAGGAASDAELDGLNLAEVLTDGVKIHVPVVGEVPLNAPSADSGIPGSGGTATGTSGKGNAKVNINTASVEELGTLPRVGPVTAQRIVDWRKEHGPFASVDELDAVDGIGPKLMESLKDLVTVQGG